MGTPFSGSPFSPEELYAASAGRFFELLKNFTPPTADVSRDWSQLAGPLAEGAIAIAVMEPLDSDKPAVKAFLAAQQKYKPNTKPTTYSMHGYQAGKLFAEVLKRSGGKTDEASIVAALEGMKGYDTGLMAPLSFSRDQHAGALAGAIMKAENGKWKIISDWLGTN